MKVCLITPLCMSDFVTPEVTLKAAKPEMAPQLGILCLAASLIEHGFEPTLFNLDQLFIDFLTLRTTNESISDLEPATLAYDPREFFAFLMKHLTESEFDVVGFGTISSTLPLTIRLAKRLKQISPKTMIVLGGPQASVVDTAILDKFAQIDFILRGEADWTLPALLKILSGQNTTMSLNDIDGISFRQSDELVRNPKQPRVEDLDSLPFPAFHLDSNIMNRTAVHLEIGRGCPFACTFCSTNDFFRRKFRLKSDEIMLQQMTKVRDSFNITNFSLVHDMYTIDRKRVLSFCDAVENTQAGFAWSCSARTDCVDAELLASMSRAGCKGIFFGIETGSPRLQKLINKNLDLDESRRNVSAASENGMNTAVALITAFPDETREDLRQTANFFVDSLRFVGAAPQMSLLAPLAETPLTSKHWNELQFDEIYSDMSHQGWRLDEEDLALIRMNKDIFPNFYSIPTRHMPRKQFSEIRDFLLGMETWFRWLPIALLADSGDYLSIYENWQQWVTKQELPPSTSPAPYYCRSTFPMDFGRFIRTCYIPLIARLPNIVSAVTAVEIDGPHAKPSDQEYSLNENIREVFGLAGSHYPFLKRPGGALRLAIDYDRLVDRMRKGQRLEDPPLTPSTIVLAKLDPATVSVQQLNQIGSEIVSACDGRSSIEKVIAVVGSSAAALGVSRIREAVLLGLSLFHSWNLISFAQVPATGPDVVMETTLQEAATPA